MKITDFEYVLLSYLRARTIIYSYNNVFSVCVCVQSADQQGGYGKSPRRGGHQNNYKPY